MRYIVFDAWLRSSVNGLLTSMMRCAGKSLNVVIHMSANLMAFPSVLAGFDMRAPPLTSSLTLGAYQSIQF